MTITRKSRTDAQHLTERAQRHAAAATARDTAVSEHVLHGASVRDVLMERRAADRLRRRANRHGCRAAAHSEAFLQVATRPGPLARHALLLAALIAAAPATYCGDPRHEDDVRQLAEWLDCFGLMSERPVPRETTRPPADGYGRCTICRMVKRLRKDGALASHPHPAGGRCNGSGTDPEVNE